MAMIIVKELEEGPNGTHVLGVDGIQKQYPQLVRDAGGLLVTLQQVWDHERKRVTMQPHKVATVPYTMVKQSYGNPTYVIDLTSLTEKLGVPLGSFVELIVTNVIQGESMVPAYPGELRTTVEHQFQDRVKKEMLAIEKTAQAFESVGLLHQKGWITASSDLQVALVRLEDGDFDASIVSFRKVVEALRNELAKGPTKIRGSDGKTSAMADFLAKTFHLLSASGLHTATVGLRDEAMLARDVTIAATRFVAQTGSP